MLKSVDFWSRLRAEAFAFTARHAVISITDPGQEPARIAGTATLLRLSFFDLTEDIGHPDFPPEKLFVPQKAQALRRFIDDVQRARDIDTCIVHCEAGISRSAAVALALEAFTGAAFPTRAKASLANTLVVQVCQAELGTRITVPPHRNPSSSSFFGNS